MSPLPYLIKNDTYVLVLLMIATLTLMYIFIYHKQDITHNIKTLHSAYGKNAKTQLLRKDVVHFIVVELLLGMFAALLIIDYQSSHTLVYSEYYCSLPRIALFGLVAFACLMVRNLLYGFIGMVFFHKKQIAEWFYLLLLKDLICAGICLIASWLLIYLRVDIYVSVILALSVYTLPQILLYFKGTRLLYAAYTTTHTQGHVSRILLQLYFIPYLCALEGAPIALCALSLYQMHFL